MKKSYLFCLMLCSLALLSLPVLADTYVSGPVLGTWTAALSPYVALGELEVPTGQNLTIESGVHVLFAGHYKLTVHGSLTAMGAPGDSILFSHQQPYPSYTWGGIFFETASAPSILAYCAVEWGYAQGAIGSVQAKGGGTQVLGSTVTIHDCRFSNNNADAKGGGIYLNYASGEIYNTLISNNNCQRDGAGIFAENTTSPYIHNCEIKYNTAHSGAGIDMISCNGILDNNYIHHNNANSSNGGGIYLYNSSPAIRYCKINNNTSSSSTGTGLYCTSSSNPIVHHTELCFNNYTAIYVGDNCNILVNNCTFFGNNSYIIRTGNYTTVNGVNNIMIASPYTFYIGYSSSVNMNYCNIQVPWPGIGNLNNIAPAFVNSYGGDFNLMPFSLMIDAGDPNSTLDPDGTRADIGAHYFNQNQPQGTCQITLTPIGAPIVLPPQGGLVWFTIFIQNSPDYFNLFDGWLTLQLPDSQVVPLLLRHNLYLPANGIVLRSVSLNISASSSPGTYTVRGYVGTWPSGIEDWDSFTFVKSPTAGDGSGAPATVTITDGDITQTVTLPTEALPSSTKLLGHYPDPFNPTTTISYQLSASSRVSLRVYDTAGRLVTTLVDGWRAAGTHEVTFDGSGLASGVYLYTLQADRYHASGKMTLLK